MALVLRVAGVIATWFPPAVVSLVYATWLAACVELGRMPVPMRDDPKYVGTVTALLDRFAMFGLAAGFVPFLMATSVLLVASLVPNLPDRRHVLRRLGVAACGGLLLYALSRWDPGRVIAWLGD